MPIPFRPGAGAMAKAVEVCGGFNAAAFLRWIAMVVFILPVSLHAYAQDSTIRLLNPNPTSISDRVESISSSFLFGKNCGS